VPINGISATIAAGNHIRQSDEYKSAAIDDKKVGVGSKID
jgi:hypothetical protein